ncbi:hypothetical protein LGM58_38670 [Burkholderia contaminans]|uniref:hypothetical protein n=1 Tax=Burkholderia contaminans TaxID=488447 RepID=UPI001CF56DA0|nr:hypothetical protein [Burkholderia contaminans]MCA7889109.1 hypothetical protein [Burkholderia contaminans]
MKLDIHQRAALWWVLGAPFVFMPVVAASPRPHVGHWIAQGVALVTICIAACPVLLRWRLFRQLFCWTDAFSPAQRAALTARNMRGYYLAAADGGYVARIKPYFFRVAIGNAVLLALSMVSSEGAVSVFMTWYPMGVFMLMAASLPWATLLSRRP